MVRRLPSSEDGFFCSGGPQPAEISFRLSNCVSTNRRIPRCWFFVIPSRSTSLRTGSVEESPTLYDEQLIFGPVTAATQTAESRRAGSNQSRLVYRSVISVTPSVFADLYPRSRVLHFFQA